MLLFRLPFLLLEALLRESATALGKVVALLRGGEADVTVYPVAPEAPSPRTPRPEPAARPATAPPPTADEAIRRRVARDAAAAPRPVDVVPEPAPRPRRRAATPPPAPPAPPAPVVPAPDHVDTEPTLVESFGPGDDVAAVFQVDAPWDGYDDQAAQVIVVRLREADAATKGVVRLYEQQNKQRRTVLRATD